MSAPTLFRSSPRLLNILHSSQLLLGHHQVPKSNISTTKDLEYLGYIPSVSSHFTEDEQKTLRLILKEQRNELPKPLYQ